VGQLDVPPWRRNDGAPASASEYALAVSKEHRWLPVLAPQLPLPIPVPLAKGEPGAGYPYSWSVYPWLDGESASADAIADPVRFAVELAGFLTALRSIDSADGPRPGKHNWFRGGTLRTYDRQTQNALAQVYGHVDGGLARQIWENALDARWDGVESWFHGDVSEGNLLLKDGQLAAVIDFGTCGVGDPACDLAIAWTLLTAEGRQAFRERLAVGPAEWARGRGWALWKALATYASTLGDGEEAAPTHSVFIAGAAWMHTRRAGPDPVLVNPCGTPAGPITISPGPPSRPSSPTMTCTRPSRMTNVSS